LQYAAIVVNLTIDTVSQGSSSGLAIKAAWDDYISSAASGMPTPLQAVFASTPSSQTWSWLTSLKVGL
jgi:hypothetical protein